MVFELFKSIPYLIAGAVLTILSAWSCALWVKLDQPRPMKEKFVISPSHPYFDQKLWASLIPDRAKGLGYSLIYINDIPETSGFEKLIFIEAGFPAACVMGELVIELTEDGPAPRHVSCFSAPRSVGPIPVEHGTLRLLPYAPGQLWRGFLINTAFWSALAFVGWRLPVRRAITFEERGQKIKYFSPMFIPLRAVVAGILGVSIAVGISWLYALARDFALETSERTVGITQTGPQEYWRVSRSEGTGVVMTTSAPDGVGKLGFVPDELLTARERGIPEAATVPDPWLAPLLDDVPPNARAVVAYGWPWPSMYVEYVSSGRKLRGTDGVFRGEILGGMVLDENESRDMPRALPLRPIKPGMIANVSLYGGSVFIVLVSLVVARRIIRKRSGQCPVCGIMPPDISRGCVECGWGIKPNEPVHVALDPDEGMRPDFVRRRF